MLSRNALHWACIGGKVSTVRMLIDYNINIDIPDRDHVTPLMHAVLYRHYDVSKVLIDAGCDVMISDRLDCSCLHVATFKGLSDITELLIKNGCIANQSAALGTPLVNLLFCGDVTNIRLLIEAGYDLSTDRLIKDKGSLCREDTYLCEYIAYEMRNASPLIRICRTKIRSTLRDQGNLDKIKCLPLPNSIKCYLRLEDIV